MRHLTFLLGLVLVLAACGGTADRLSTPQAVSENSVLLERVRQAQSQKAVIAENGARLELKRRDDADPTKIAVEVWLRNPSSLEIASVRSFLAFDPRVLRGEAITLDSASPFAITAPGEQSFDAVNGLAMIGVSAAAGNTSTAADVLIATVRFTRLAGDFTTIDFYDAAPEGHTRVLAKGSDGAFRDVLKTPILPALVFLEQ